MKQRWKEDKTLLLFVCFLFLMMLYYGWRMFALTPWYDELYTYDCFISKGPIYAGIHWPLPNNHMGYSVLSGILYYLGNPYLGLRGVSYLCAILNLCLLFWLGCRFLRKELALAATMLYAAMNLTNQLAVQGRGYTLGVTCFLTATIMVYQICRQERVKKRYYFGFVAAVVWGLYTLPSGVYWVVPLCIAGGCYDLWDIVTEEKSEKRKKWMELLKLIGAALVAALGTVIIYSLVWMAIGSNLLMKDSASAFYNVGHFTILKQAPLEAWGTGMQYMLDTPYIQSVARQGYLPKLTNWLGTLFSYYYSGSSAILSIVTIIGLIFLVVQMIRKSTKNKSTQQKDGNLFFFMVYLFIGIAAIPIMLYLQSALPYYRVFSYAGVLLSLLLCVLMQAVFDKVTRQGVIWLPVILIFVMLAGLLGFSDYNNQYGEREHEIADAYTQVTISDYDNICVTDCNQQYLLKFLYGITCKNQEITEADLVLFDKRMLDEAYTDMTWEFYHYYGDIPWDYVQENLEVIYENKDYVLYAKGTN